MDGLKPNPVFGDWQGTATEVGAELVETPIGEPCLHCEEEIVDGDVGMMMTCIGEDSVSVKPAHRECLALHVLGHEVGVCNCTDWAGFDTEREAALECWERIKAGRFKTG